MAGNKFGNHVLWDAIERSGKTAKMHQEAAHFGLQHTFTIIKKSKNGTDYYHFGNNDSSQMINLVYLSNFELLERFILYFKEQVNGSKELLQAYSIQFQISNHAKGYETAPDRKYIITPNKKKSFIKDTQLNNTNPYNPMALFNERLTLIHKDHGQVVVLPPQKTNTLLLLMTGHSIKKIAIILGLSPRTVEHYVENLRDVLGCQNSKELIAFYQNQIKMNY